ncbi:MarR family transcriptional regulator [Sinomonas sp. JGH33]|uniref:MarR family transcriptional regulator n=1 Tax=Sinomonas terricola TaxID=3110330 RepID=A0ABU5T839_9MICC|nr:MarR family transcriptional regulator [Sinomonas sp. JGH33]MEA5455682.1 MarR family transcriptional regulator [Sinomonas sp. JGH33]
MTEPRWLSADERRAWLALLSVTTLLPAALDAHLTSLGRLSLFDYNVLAMLSEADGRSLPMKELAARTSASLSRLSHVVSKLEKRGWIDREPSPDDARVTTAHLTDHGWETILDLAPDHVERVREMVFDGLDENDTRLLADVAEKIVAQLDDASWIFRDVTRDPTLPCPKHQPARDGGGAA